MLNSHYDQNSASSVINNRYYFLLFFIWPFVAFILALANYSQKEARKVVYLFIIYYGLTYFVGETGMDSAAYIENLKFNATLPFLDFFKIIGGLYTSDTSIDIVEPFISFVVSRFTRDYRLLFAVYASVFGFFYLKSVNLLYSLYHQKPGWNTLIFMIFFLTVIPITNINGFRMWTAAWVFFYGTYHVVIYRDIRYLLLTLGACLIHWSFISVNVLLFIYYLVGNRNFIYLPISIISFFLPNLLTPLFNWISLKLGGGFQTRYVDYTNIDYIFELQESNQQASWFVNLSKSLIFYYLIFSVIIIYFFRRGLMKEKAEKNLFSFLLLLLSFVNFGMGIPSFGNRYQIIFILFSTLYVFFYFLKLPGSKINMLTLLGLFPMALYFGVEFRIGSEVINSWTFLPGLGMPLFIPGIPLADFIFNN